MSHGIDHNAVSLMSSSLSCYHPDFLMTSILCQFV